MMTPNEIERVQMIEQAFSQMNKDLSEMFGDGLPPGMLEIVLGSMMAAVDATFAIRDGQAWRGLTDPKEIAARLLRDAKLGEI